MKPDITRMLPIGLLFMVQVTAGLFTAQADPTTNSEPEPPAFYACDQRQLAIATIELTTIHDATRDKNLQVRITYPDAPGPFPVIVWCHGATGTKDMYEPIVRHWAAHGYVCLQANHSDSRAFRQHVPNSPGVFLDWQNRPKDVAFLLDSLDLLEDRHEVLQGKLDATRIGVGGHSFGAHTAQLVAGATTTVMGKPQSHTDPRPLAFVLLSPQGIGEGSGGLDASSWQDVTRPFLVITGTNDPGRTGVGWEWRLDPYRHAASREKYLLVIEGAYHGFGGAVGDEAFRNAGPPNPDHLRYVQASSLAFWDAHLKDDEEARAFLASDKLERESHGEATLSYARAQTPAAAEVTHETAPYEDAVWHDTERDRDLPVRIYVPALDHGSGPFPAIVFSHGGGESREAFTYLGTHWAEHGYIVVFLTHLGSDRAVIDAQGMRAMNGGGPANFHLRPEDVRFALDTLLSDDPGSELLRGRVDSDRVAVAGQCAGATTALAMVGLRADLPGRKDATFTDPRFKCALALSPQPGGRRGGPLHADSWAQIQTPTLMVTGTRDFNWFPEATANPNRTRAPFDGLPPGDKYLVQIKDAEHNAFTDSVPYYPARERDPRHHGWIQQATTAFLDAYLKGDGERLGWLREKTLEAETDGECMQDQKLAGAAETTSQKPIPSADGNDAQTEAPTQDRVARLLGLFDGDNDQALSRDESPDRLKAIFERIDRDGDGRLTEKELRPVLDRSSWRQDSPTTATEPSVEDPSFSTGGPHPVAVIEKLVLHDAQRDKDLTLRITYPKAGGSFPVILLAHAVRRHRSDFQPLAEHWAANGYVVLQADHADTGRMGADWRDRARDMSFIIDSLDEIAREVPKLAQQMDATRIGAGGHLIGAYAACALVGMKGQGFGPGEETADFMDPRIGAALLLGPQGRGGELDATSWEEIDKPMLVAAGSGMPSRRTSNPPEWRTEPYRFAKPGDRYLLWVEGMDPGYAGLCRNEEVDPEPAALVMDVTTAFWDAHLKGDTEARDRLQSWPVAEADKEHFRLECRAEVSLDADKREGDEGASADEGYDFSRLDQFIEESVPRLGGGCAFILLDGDRVIHRNGYGTFAPEKVVPIASASKWISGGVIMALVDAGVISLDDPASKYLSCFTGKKADITIRQMFSHTHGLVRGDARDYLHDPTLTMDGAVVGIAGYDLVAAPGTALYYAGSGMQVAGRICEIASGKAWPQIFREMIGDPLEMDSTDYFALGPTNNPDVAGAVRTCVDDYGNYLTMLLNRGVYKGQRILSEQAVETMLSNQSGCPPILKHPYDVLDIVDPALATAPYGIGCWLEDFDPQTGKTTAITSAGGFGCMPFLDLRRNVAGVLLPYNRKWQVDAKGRRYNDAHRVYYEARAILNEIIDARAEPPADPSLDTPSAALDQLDPSEAAAGGTAKAHGDLAADYSARNGGRAVLVMVDGDVVFERYDNGFSADTATHLHSATKGFWGPAIAAMIEDGLVESFDEPACNTLSEWRNDPRKSLITLRHLLNLSAGLVQDVVNLQGHDRETLAPDLYKHAIRVPVARDPGAVFQYGPSCYYVLGEIMKRKLVERGQTPVDYLKERILDPIGADTGDWVHDASGNPHIPNGAHLTARSWAKYGQWLLQGGEWNGEQVVAGDLLAELIEPSEANPGHGLALWLNQPGGRGAHPAQIAPPGSEGGFIYHHGCPDLFAALGAGKCRMYMIPSFNMVVVRQSDIELDRYQDNAFLSLLLTGEPPDIMPRMQPTRPVRSQRNYDAGDAGRQLGRLDRNADGTELLTQDVNGDADTVDVDALPADATPTCIKLLRDGQLVDVIEWWM